MAESIALVAFLGNPGSKYAGTRHNAGQMFLEHLEKRRTLQWQLKFKGRYAQQKNRNGDLLYWYVSSSFMNKSGDGIQEIAAFFRIKPSQILIVYDELDLKPGAFKFQRGGGLKGHNGLRSIQQKVGSGDFARIAIGIGRPPHSSFEIQRWVLSGFHEGELADLNSAFDNAEEIIEKIEAGEAP